MNNKLPSLKLTKKQRSKLYKVKIFVELNILDIIEWHSISDISFVWASIWKIFSWLWENDEALKIYKQALKLEPKNIKILNNIWIILCSLWRYKNAVDIYSKAFLIDSNNSEILNNFAAALDKYIKNKNSLIIDLI